MEQEPQRIEFDCPERADGFMSGVRFMDHGRTVTTTLEAPAEPWSHGKTGKWVVIVTSIVPKIS
jgi:hypothetical protein